MGARWYVLRTQSRGENLAASDLTRDGFEVFFPRVKGLYSRLKNGEAPLFPGYLFLRCNLERDGLPSFRTTPRVLGWMRFEDDIAWVPDQVVDEIRKRSEIINREGGFRRRFRSGELVRVVSGAIQGLAEVIEDSKSIQSKVRVILEFMGRSVPALVSGFDLQPVDDLTVPNRQSTRRTRGKGRWIRRPEPTQITSG